jgi:hypothetical protein
MSVHKVREMAAEGTKPASGKTAAFHLSNQEVSFYPLEVIPQVMAEENKMHSG